MRQSYVTKMTVCITDHSTMYQSKLALIETYVFFFVSMCPKLCSRPHGISYHNGADLVLKSNFHFCCLKISRIIFESLKLLSYPYSEENWKISVKLKVLRKIICDFKTIWPPCGMSYVKDWGARLGKINPDNASLQGY